jgi:hypothetical protein
MLSGLTALISDGVEVARGESPFTPDRDGLRHFFAEIFLLRF